MAKAPPFLPKGKDEGKGGKMPMKGKPPAKSGGKKRNCK